MAIELKKTPYEFMARWDDAGNLLGAHVVFREAAVKDGVEISSKYGDVLPVSLAGGAGFPLAQILSALNTSAIVDSEAKAEEIATLKTAKADADTARDEALAEKDGKNAEVAALTAQIAAMQPPVDSFSRKQIKVALSDASLLDSFSRKAIKVALSDASLLEPFETAVADPQDGPQKLAMISWEEDDTFSKTSPALVLTFARMTLTEAQIAALFVAAALL